ncbi:MAG TPA: hypothetical protein VEX86_13085 [Longimicrobium sp.]|nr:hypothetical protein [Longimicrobium sp.]
MSEEFRGLSFGELTSGNFIVDLPVRFRVPAGWVAVPGNYPAHTWWMSELDCVRHARDESCTPRDGFFSVTFSMNVGYDRSRNVFFGGGEGDGDETTMAAGYARAGVENVAVERYDIAGIPVLFAEGRQEGRRIALCYIATLIDTNVVFLFYSHPTPLRDIDGRRWEEMRRAILSSADEREVGAGAGQGE